MKKRYLRIGDLKRNAFIVAAATCMGLTSCGPDNNNNNTGANEEVKVPDGIITELTEEAPDQWKITDERTTVPGASMAILKYQDGRVDTLKGLELENQMKNVAANQNTYQQGGFGLGSVLWWSGMGYMAGRMMSPRPGYYANPGVMNNTAAWRQNVQTYRQQSTAPRSGRSGYFRGRSSGSGFGG
ncbi:hypothetical protein JAO76_00630 [Pontibacter sp. BT310]|jgi:hypothetical protein|uniref:UPF0323 domain-containing protein n=1 Tax=Pontibacter populi TaxID=890055 RepID=A0ABS6X8V9_9BACT|nr:MULTISPECIES: hypothetical protein [Pontibacter]MBJ6116677.1 hypothetical protein [Pontibacter sp. BT310]MBR0569101.1 hypothetical protein [Microvirga sp. STS03]MBW3363531.1 hypothetical protein [Pontibacter populi]